MAPDQSIDSAAVQNLLSTHYGLMGKLIRLPGENLNYLVQTASEERYVLKITAGNCPDTVVEMEHLAVEHLSQNCPDFRLPRTVLTRTGQVIADSDKGGNSNTRARLLEFVAGTSWGELSARNDQLMHDLGRQLARIDLALAEFTHPAMYRSHRWDLTALEQHRSNVNLVPDSGRRRIVDRAIHVWTASAQPLFERLPTAFIHGDINDENLLVDCNRIVGVLDFGDSLCNPLICNLAIALAYVLLEQRSPLPTAAGIVAAYNEVRPLDDNELSALFPLLCGRLANTVLVAAERRQSEPDHPNWFVTESAAWVLLESFSAISPGEARAILSSGIGNASPVDAGRSPDKLLEKRRAFIAPSLSVSYNQPIKMVRARGQFMFDQNHNPYLDLVNNICHVGHCHPHVVAAGTRQMALLNTNTRYLYDGLTDYAERLCATLPDGLDTCFFVNSGSEANELALRLARTHTGRRDVLVVDTGYHGNTGRLIDISSYKFMGAGGSGRTEDWVHAVPIPDGYRGRHKGNDQRTARAYSDEIRKTILRCRNPVAAFITESIWSCGGQIVPPEGYLHQAFEHVREAGGLCVVDEVQVGFGRVGRTFWGFELQGVVPDIVVMGKPMGNGHPIGAVVTTSQIAKSFDNGMEFFSSFGGNPVSCAIGMAVLDVLDRESLQLHALSAGNHFLTGLKALARRHPCIGEVRGAGLFLGAELVLDATTREPAAREAAFVIERMKERGILMSTDGPHNNVLKIKPPLVITQADIDMVLRGLDDVLSEASCLR